MVIEHFDDINRKTFCVVMRQSTVLALDAREFIATTRLNQQESWKIKTNQAKFLDFLHILLDIMGRFLHAVV